VQTKLPALIAAVTSVLVPAYAFAQCPDSPYNVPTRVFDLIHPRPGTATLANPRLTGDAPPVLTIVALGDSVVWGNGLKNSDKFIHLSGQEIADKTQRAVQIVSFAHSAATLQFHPPSPGPPSSANGYVPYRSGEDLAPPGDLNAAYPTTREQASCAAAAYPTAEIVVLDGCINETGAMDIALPPIVNAVTKDEIERRVHASCSEPMQQALVQVQDTFPRATIILLNYYQIVSARSSIFKAVTGGQPSVVEAGSSERSLKKLAEKENEIQAMSQHTAVKTDKTAAIQDWPGNSTAFLNTSQACFEWAIAAASPNSKEHWDPANPCPRPLETLPPPSPDAVRRGYRTYLAAVENRPEYAYGAKDKHLWSLPVRILFWVVHRDDMYRDRERICNTHYPGPDGTKVREICKFNPAAHPNRKGAKAYACSIILDPALPCAPNQAGILDRAWAR
jgi:hypothetical protein